MFELTPQEKQVILFLITVTLVGIGINSLSKKYSQSKIIAYLNQNPSKINLNKADKETLISIPGLGEKLAQRIIEYRRQQGGFEGIEELKNIKGLAGYRYEKIKDYFTLR